MAVADETPVRARSTPLRVPPTTPTICGKLQPLPPPPPAQTASKLIGRGSRRGSDLVCTTVLQEPKTSSPKDRVPVRAAGGEGSSVAA